MRPLTKATHGVPIMSCDPEVKDLCRPARAVGRNGGGREAEGLTPKSTLLASETCRNTRPLRTVLGCVASVPEPLVFVSSTNHIDHYDKTETGVLADPFRPSSKPFVLEAIFYRGGKKIYLTSNRTYPCTMTTSLLVCARKN